MIFKESKVLILQNLRSTVREEKSVKKSIESRFFSSKLSINQDGLQNDFIENFKAVSGEVHILEKKKSLTAKINEFLQELDTQAVSFWRTGPLESLEITSDTDPASADIGITGVDFAIADTGTLVILSNTNQPRLTSLLPPIHIAVLKKETIVPNIHALFVKLGKFYQNYNKLCSCISFITGPSRTADIELNLTLGVHGPGRVIVIII